MAQSASVNSIAIQLQQLLHSINTRLIVAAASPGTVKPHEIATSPKIRELENWGRQIDLYIKRLWQVENRLDMRASQTHSVPRHLRFRERQSIADKRDALHQALSLADETKDRLKELLHRMLIPDRVQSINRAGMEFDKALEETADLLRDIESAQHRGTLDQQLGMQLRSEIKKDLPVIQNLPAAQVPMVDVLLTLSLLIRLLAMSIAARHDDDDNDHADR